MKMVQSYWTKPIVQSNDYVVDSRFNGGWLHRKYNYFSWALSCLQLRNYYENLELVTDQFGKYILIDKLQLPYSSVSTALDDLDDSNPEMWTFGKLYTYTLQDEPFLHVDGDVFIWKPFDERISSANLAAQNIETADEVYAPMINIIRENFDYVPSFFHTATAIEQMHSVNAGILGGANTAYFKDYVAEVFSFVKKNEQSMQKHIHHSNYATFNVICEQLFFGELANRSEEKIEYLFPTTYIPDSIANFHAREKNQQFCHFIGGEKKRRMPYLLMENELSRQYPEYYNRILNLTYTNEI